MSTSIGTSARMSTDSTNGTFPPGLIITRTPLRLSLAGGGTDLPAFYEKEDGAVLSSAINHYIYVTVKRHGSFFDEPIRINYSKSEMVDDIEDIENDIARECLRFLKIKKPIYVSVVGDLPAASGLGGSSSFTVGLLNALHAYRGERVGASQLAEEASRVEIEVLGQPIGKQDQYAAAYGGLNLFQFRRGGDVRVEPQRLDAGVAEALFDQLLLFWTGIQRPASSILDEQCANVETTGDSLVAMRDQAYAISDVLRTRGADPYSIGSAIHESWLLKRTLASNVSSTQIDDWYERARTAGAIGGKIAGAGGGGFLLFVVPRERQNAVRDALAELVEVSVRPEVHGSQLMLPFMHW